MTRSSGIGVTNDHELPSVCGDVHSCPLSKQDMFSTAESYFQPQISYLSIGEMQMPNKNIKKDVYLYLLLGK